MKLPGVIAQLIHLRHGGLHHIIQHLIESDLPKISLQK